MATTLDQLNIEISASASSVTQQIGKLVSGLKHLQVALNELNGNNLNAISSSLGNVTSAFSNLANTNAANAINQTSQALGNIGNTVNGVSQVAQNMNNVANAANNTSGALQNVGKAINTTSAVSEQIKNASRSFQKLDVSIDEAIEHSTALKMSFNKLRINTSTDKLEEVKKMLKEVEAEYNDLRDTMAQTLKSSKSSGSFDKKGFEQDKQELKALRNEYLQLMLIKNKLSQKGEPTPKVNQEAYSSLSKTFEILGNSVSSVMSKIGKFTLAFGGVPWAINAARSAVERIKGSVDKFFKSLSRVWKMLRLMVMRKILQAFIKNAIEGFKNMVQYSDKFNSSVSLLWNSMRQLGNATSAMVAPLINALAPALNALIQKLIEAVNWVNQLFSALTGSTVWTKAKQLTDSYADSLDQTSKNAKKANKQLQGFDALNNLTTQKSSGTDIADMFETEEVPNKFADLAEKLKHMLDTGNFFDLGQDLGKALKDMLDNIPWDEIKAKARKLGKALASLINGFISVSGLGYSIGKTLAEALNTAFEFLNSFVHELNWDRLGSFIAETFNGFFDNIDWDLIYDTFVTAFSGMADAINAFIEKFHWNNLSTAISSMVNTLTNSIYTFFKKVKWKELGSELGNQLRKTILKIDWKMLGKAVGVVIQSAINFVKSFLRELNMRDIANAFEDFFKGVFEEVNVWDLAKVLMAALGVALISAIPTVISQVLMANALKAIIKSAVTESTTAAVTSLSSIATPLIAIASVIGEFLMVKDGFYDLAKGADNVALSIAEIATGVGVAVTACTIAFGPAGTIVALAAGAVGAIAGIVKALDEISGESVANTLRQVLVTENGTPLEEAFSNVAETIRDVGDSCDDIITAGSRISETQKDIDNTVNAILSIEGAWDQSLISTEDAVKKLTEQFNTLADSAKEKFGEVQDTLLVAFGGNGAIAQALGNLGVNVEAAQVEITGITAEAQNQIDELNAQIQALLNENPDDKENLLKLQSQIAELSGYTDEATNAMKEFYAEIDFSNLSYENYLNEDGFDMSKFTTDLDSLTNALQDSQQKVEDAGKMYALALQEAIDTANKLGDDVKAEELQKTLDELPNAIEEVQQEMSEKATSLVDAIQVDLIDAMDDVLTNGLERYDIASALEKFWYGFDENAMASADLNNYINNTINQVAIEIEKSFGELGIDGAGWAREAAQKIKGELVLYDPEMGELLVSDYEEVFAEALKEVQDKVSEQAKDLGQATTDGVVEGMNNGDVADAAEKMAEAGLEAYAEAQDSNSPSEEYKKLSEYSVQGLVLGFEENEKTLIDKVAEVAKNTIEAFKQNNTEEMWIDAMGGIVPAFEKVMDNAIKAMKAIWNDFVDVFNDMAQFEIPEQEYNGQKISSSEKIKLGSLPKFASGGFPGSGQLFIGNENGIEMMGRMGNKNVVANNEQIVDGISKGVASANSEQNALLRQQNALLQGILEKETGISSDDLFRSVQRSANSYYQRTGRYAF